MPMLRRVRVHCHAAHRVFDGCCSRRAAAVMTVRCVIVVMMVVLGHGTLPYSLPDDRPIGPGRIPIRGI
jgi:hypothetical protein